MEKPNPAETEAALVLVVPEVEPLVAPLRMEYDPSAPLGVPAHITVNYPFLPGVHRSEVLDRKLTDLFSSVEPLSFVFRTLGRFPDVLYLPPDPDEGIKNLIERVAETFPESPPYGGRIEHIIPHLTVAQFDDPERLDAIERALAQLVPKYLPIELYVEAVWLMDNRSGRWRRQVSFPLEGPAK
jgi:2'-5' RNA ligase